MPRQLKVYAPKWIRWFLAPVFLAIWGAITYGAFFAPPGQDRVPVFVWVLISVVLGLVVTMIWLMTGGKLPAYVIEETDEEK